VTYADVLARLFAARRAGIVLGLDRVRAVLDRLGAPDRELGAVVHVGGTNGKGSTVAMIDAVARAGGARVATYTSPHLTSLTERIVVDGAPIDEAAVVAAAERVWAAGGDELTFFEQVTAIAMVHIAGARPSVTVLEVGLGGRLDATNVVAAPIAVVTGVALDHQDLLGDTLDAVAGEKAGIWKRGQAAIVGASGEPAAVPVLVDAARAAGVDRITVIDAARIAGVPAALGLAGAHQRANAAAALAAIDELAAIGAIAPIDATARAAALAAARWPGRFETVADAPRIVLDGAHNPHGAAALARAIDELPRPRVLVLGVSADKDVTGIAAALAPAVDTTIATAYAQPRALAPDALAGVMLGAGARDVRAAPDLAGALPIARTVAGPTGCVIVAGSLFLVGEARAILLGAKVDPIAVSDPAGRAGAP
jgi:dihydrofolate synthase / folylpolyglutamate synthase